MKKKISKILGVGLTIALLASLLLTVAPVMAATAITGLTVSMTPTTISAGSNYTITFDATNPVTMTAAGAPYDIIIALPLGTPTPVLGAGDMTVQSTAGFGTANAATPIAAANITVTAATATTGPIINIDLNDLAANIGEAATVRVKTLNTKIVNPPSIGGYTLTVKTSADTTAVASNTYTTTAPTILPLPGVVERYNSVGILMAQTSSISAAITAASAGDTIKVGPGTYDETIVVNKSVTITGDAATTIIKDTNASGAADGTVTISFQKTATAAGVVFDGFTVMGNVVPANAMNITGIGVTVQNCVFTKAGTATTTGAQTMVVVNPAVAATTYGNTITNCTFDTTLGTKQDTGIDVQAGFGENTIISNCSFLVDAVTVGTTEDTAIAIADGSAAKPVKVTGCTFSGASGNGVVVTTAGTVASIADSTLSNLSRALSVTLGKLTVSGSVIDTCGLATSATVTAQAAIIVASTAGVSITNTTISNSPNEVIEVTANSNLVNMMFNNLLDNVLGIDNNDGGANTLNASHNWWGVATGPAAGMNTPLSTTTGMINTTGYLGATATGTFNQASATLAAATTQKVDVAITTTAGVASPAGIIGVANYAANPGAATPYPAISGGFYDVYIGTPAVASDIATIKLYGAVTANTTAYVYSALHGTWAKCTNQGVNTLSGYVWVKTGLTITPAIGDLSGTAFALVEVPQASLGLPAIGAPLLGAVDTSLTPAFSWGTVAGATGYSFELADNPLFVLPIVSLTDGGGLTVPFYKYVGELDYSTPYYWRVKALDINWTDFSVSNSSGWVSSVFTTEAEVIPEEPEAPVWTCPVCGLTFATRDALAEHAAKAHPPEEPPVITIESPDVIVPLPAETPITPSWIYIIIGVGAVLVISVIVLIVRTRRVA